jgi:arginine decarboxylase
MDIQVSGGTGVGPTEMAAWDQALINVGVANFNIIYLSSIIPPGSTVTLTSKPKRPEGAWGDKLYVVMAQQRTSMRNQEVWAGIGWIQDPKTKQGLFTEHEGHSEAEVRADIKHTLEALAKNRGVDFGSIKSHVVGTKCVDEPVSAVAVAVFESASWRTAKSDNKKLSSFSLSRSR